MESNVHALSECWSYDADQLSIIDEGIEARLEDGGYDIDRFIRSLEYLEDVEQVCRIQNYPITLTIDEGKVKVLWFDPARTTAIDIIERYTGEPYETNLLRLTQWRQQQSS